MRTQADRFYAKVDKSGGLDASEAIHSHQKIPTSMAKAVAGVAFVRGCTMQNTEREKDVCKSCERLRAAIFNTINDLNHKRPNLKAMRGYLASVYNAPRANEQKADKP